MGRGGRSRAAIAVAALTLALFPGTAQAAGPPQLGAAWTTDVSSASATFHGEVDPEGEATAYRFEYETEAAWQANPPAERFGGAAKAPAGGAASAGSGTSFIAVSQHVSALKAATAYRYRLLATSAEGTATLEANPSGAPLAFTTQPLGSGFALPDGRGWELVSPVDKNGGAVQGPEAVQGGGTIEAALSGGALTYSSTASFDGYEALGAPQASQYISSRSGSGWSTENITTPVVSGSYGSEPNGVPYQLFSPGLERALMLNGEHCRGEGTGCPVANPPLPGSGAPEGFQDYYLRDNTANSFQALLTEANKGSLSLSASQFSVALAGASPDLRHVVLTACAKLTADATEVPGSEGCDPSEPNLYEWSGGSLSLINLLPGESHGTPGASLAAQGSAISTDGSRVYFADGGKLYLREGSETHQVDEAQGGGGEFQTATPNGEIAFFAKAGHLYRFSDHEDLLSTVDLTPGGGVAGVLGISTDGSTVFYQDASGLERWHEGTTTVAPGAQAAQESDWPPSTGTSRVSADGQELLFLSKAPLTGYDNTDQSTGQPDPEVFYWSQGAGLACLSCNPTGERPAGPSSIPGAYANGEAGRLEAGQILTDSYKPRALSADGRRAFFDSEDAIAPLDTDKASDAYQWEAQGEGSCQKPGGCVSLISSGTDAVGASFLDASESGADAYFLTSASLTEPPNLLHVTVTPEGNTDTGSADAYDARVGGGFAEPSKPIPCEADECAPLPVEPEDPTVGTLAAGAGNPPVHFPKPPCKRGFVRKHGKCVKKPHKKHHRKKGHK